MQQGLLDLMKTPPRTPLETGQRWAQAYTTYCSGAISPMGGTPLTLDVSRVTLATSLATVFATPYSPVPTTAAGIAAAFTVFWFAPPVTFSGGPPGVVTAVAGTALLQQGLISCWLSNFASRASKDQAAQAIAAVIDVFTRTVIVTHPLVPTPIIGPIS
jgi:hypothetical protein